ncbi:hypothetical protein [Actinocatenispora rupis]|nr:hypothetical protein [Actinocatenispora rupis]
MSNDRRAAEDQRRAYVIGSVLLVVVFVATLLIAHHRAGAITWYTVLLGISHGFMYFLVGFAAGHRSILGVLLFGVPAGIITYAILTTTGRLT